MKSILGGGEGSADSRGKEKDTMGIIEILDGPCGRITLFVRLQNQIKHGYGLRSPDVEECHFVEDFIWTPVNILH